MISIVKRMFGLRSGIFLGCQSGVQIALYGSFEPAEAYASGVIYYDAYKLTYDVMSMMSCNGLESDLGSLRMEEAERDWSFHSDGMTTFVQVGWSYHFTPPIFSMVKCVEYATSVVGNFGFKGLRTAFRVGPSYPYHIWWAGDCGLPVPLRRVPGQEITVDVSFKPEGEHRVPFSGRGERLADAFSRWRDDMRPPARNVYSLLDIARLELVDISVVSFPETLDPMPVGADLVDWSDACRLRFVADSFTVESAAMCALILGNVVHATGLEAKIELAIALQ